MIYVLFLAKVIDILFTENHLHILLCSVISSHSSNCLWYMFFILLIAYMLTLFTQPWQVFMQRLVFPVGNVHNINNLTILQSLFYFWRCKHYLPFILIDLLTFYSGICSDWLHGWYKKGVLIITNPPFVSCSTNTYFLNFKYTLNLIFLGGINAWRFS